MEKQIVTFPNGHQIDLPSATVAAIQQSSAKYQEPLWHFRAEKVLKLGAHQWISPNGPAAAQSVFALHSGGVLCTAWKLFNRGWTGAAEAYSLDSATYPDHPCHFGCNVIPLVDEDDRSFANTQIGWVRVEQITAIDHNYAIFIQFALLDLFSPIALPTIYG